MTKFSNKFKSLFKPTLDTFFLILGQKHFCSGSISTLNGFLTLRQNFEGTNDPILRKYPDRQILFYMSLSYQLLLKRICEKTKSKTALLLFCICMSMLRQI